VVAADKVAALWVEKVDPILLSLNKTREGMESSQEAMAQALKLAAELNSTADEVVTAAMAAVNDCREAADEARRSVAGGRVRRGGRKGAGPAVAFDNEADEKPALRGGLAIHANGPVPVAEEAPVATLSPVE
jgi:uncharacterized protein (DUF1501 family)